MLGVAVKESTRMFSLTTTHLRFVCEATTPLRLDADVFRAGSNLRGALGQVMLRSYCAGDANDPQHTATCPVHWLLAAKSKPGDDRRTYALVPPLPHGGADFLQRGATFEFGLTLFGNAVQFLPYFILAVPEMGRIGIGPGRGKFELKRVWALNPLTGESECLFGENGNVVRTPTLVVNHAAVILNAQGLMHNAHSTRENEETRDWRLGIEFLTPMRLVENGHVPKSPEFAPLFARLLERLDELNAQFGNGEGGARSEERGRTREEVMRLRELAAQVQLCEVQSRWVEVFSGSTRRGMSSPLSGFVGRAVFSASRDVWRELLPWLVWGELVQVGKATVKGNGVMRILD
jgi:hypothetical protein